MPPLSGQRHSAQNFPLESLSGPIRSCLSELTTWGRVTVVLRDLVSSALFRLTRTQSGLQAGVRDLGLMKESTWHETLWVSVGKPGAWGSVRPLQQERHRRGSVGTGPGHLALSQVWPPAVCPGQECP